MKTNEVEVDFKVGTGTLDAIDTITNHVIAI